MKKKVPVFFSGWLLWRAVVLVCISQSVSMALHAQDSLAVLTPAQFISIVKQYHPLAKQAALLPEQARAQVSIPIYIQTMPARNLAAATITRFLRAS